MSVNHRTALELFQAEVMRSELILDSAAQPLIGKHEEKHCEQQVAFTINIDTLLDYSQKAAYF